MGSFFDSSTTPASNNSVGGVPTTGGTTLNYFDDAIRELASHGPKFIRDFYGAATVGGTANDIVITLNSGTLAAEFPGMGGGFIATADNTGACTLNVGSAGAQPLKKSVLGVETALSSGDIQAGNYYIFLWRSTWDSGNGAWQLLSFSDNSQVFSLRNKIINGNFDIWQRGTSLSAFGYLADRWQSSGAGSTIVQSRQSFALGQTDVPGNPKYYHRTVVTSVAGSGNYVINAQKIEGVQTFAGETVTLSFWAKADASKNVCVEFAQFFGTGGSPSSQVSISPNTIALTTSWQKFTISVSIPSISGKTLGTDGNDFLGLLIWYDAGSNFNARTNSLGQQSGTFDIAQVQLEAGNTATPFEQRSVGQELALCHRYYRTVSWGIEGYTAAGTARVRGTFVIPEMRATPTITRLTTGGTQTNIRGSDPATYVRLLAINASSMGYDAESAAAGLVQSYTNVEALSAEI